MSVSPVPAIIDGLVETLSVAEGLQDVTIRSGPFDATGVTEVVQFDEVIFDDEQETMGLSNRRLDFTVRGIVECVRFGAGEDVISAARSRAFEIMDVVESIFVTGFAVTGVSLKYAEVKSGKYVPSLIDGGHRAHLEFSIRFLADLG